MFNVLIRSSEELKFIAKDCYEAVVAYPQGHKAIEYLETAHKCEKELISRGKVAAFRLALKTYLQVGNKWINNSHRKLFRQACTVMGIRKLKGTRP